MASDSHRHSRAGAARASVRQRRRPPRLVPRCDRLNPWPGAGRTSTTPTSCAWTSIRRRRPQGRRPRVAMVVARASPSIDLEGFPSPSSRGTTSTSGCSLEQDFTDAARRSPSLAKSSAGAEAGDQQVVEGGAPRRLRRLQPERSRPPVRLGLPCARSPTRASHPLAWDRCPVDPAELRPDTVPARLRTSASVGRDRQHAGSLESLLDSGARGRLPALAAALREAARRAASGCSRARPASVSRADRTCRRPAPCRRASAGPWCRGGCGRR